MNFFARQRVSVKSHRVTNIIIDKHRGDYNNSQLFYTNARDSDIYLLKVIYRKKFPIYLSEITT